MLLKYVSLTNFRSYSRLDTEIPERMLLLSGGNAQGKTSFLEALFYCASFSSPLASSVRDLIRFDALTEPLAVARIVVRYETDSKEHKLEVRLIRDDTEGEDKFRKEILHDDLKTTAQKVIGAFPAVLFLPQMMRIAEGAPVDRRRYLNIMLSQSVPGYAKALSEYEGILRRRNALLKNIQERKSDPAQLVYWDNMLAQRGAVLIRARADALIFLEQVGAEIHRSLTDGKELLQLRYQPGFDPLDPEGSINNAYSIEESGTAYPFDENEIAARFLHALDLSHGADVHRGLTGIGPHKDDFEIIANRIDLRTFGSRGQIRTALLSLKLAEIEWMQQKLRTAPLLLLDETLAELDEKRSADLLSRLEDRGQAILTTTDQTHFTRDFAAKNSIWHVENGVIVKQSTELSA